MKLLQGITPATLFLQAAAQEVQASFYRALYQFLSNVPAFAETLPGKAELIAQAEAVLQRGTDTGSVGRQASYYFQGAFGKDRQLFETVLPVWILSGSSDHDADIAARACLFLQFFREQHGVVSALYRFDANFTLIAVKHHSETFIGSGKVKAWTERADVIKMITADSIEHARSIFKTHLQSLYTKEYPGTQLDDADLLITLVRLSHLERDAITEK